MLERARGIDLMKALKGISQRITDTARTAGEKIGLDRNRHRNDCR